MNKNQQISLLKDVPVPKALFHLILPAVITSLVSTLHNLIDTIYISQLQNNAMIAATTLAMPVIAILQALGDGLGVGGGSYLGRLLGAKDELKIKRTINTVMTLAIIVSFAAFLSSFVFLDALVALFTDDPETAVYTYQYIQILTMFSVFQIVKQILSYLLRSVGDVRFPMIAIVISIGTNILLNPFLMFDFGLGLQIRGAAYATIIAEAIAAGMMLIRLIKHDSIIQWSGHLELNTDSIKQIWNVGIAAFLRNGLPSLSYGLFATSAGLFGTAFVAAAGLARKGEHIATFVIMGIAHGFQPFAAYNFGAKNKKRLMEGIKLSILVSVLYGTFMFLLFFLIPAVIMNLLTNDQSLIEISAVVLRGYAFGMPVLGIYQILAGCFQSMGKGKLSFFSSVLRQGLIYCPMIYVLPRMFGEIGFACVQPLCDWISALIVCLLSKALIEEIRHMPDQNEENTQRNKLTEGINA